MKNKKETKIENAPTDEKHQINQSPRKVGGVGSWVKKDEKTGCVLGRILKMTDPLTIASYVPQVDKKGKLKSVKRNVVFLPITKDVKIVDNTDPDVKQMIILEEDFVKFQEDAS